MNVDVEEIVKIQNKFIDIAISLTAEKDFNKLLYKIVEEARHITGADGGTLYLLEEDRLVHKIMQTKSMNYYKGQDGEKIEIEPLELKESNVAAYTAINKKLVNVVDVYETDLFDFSGPKRFDEMTGYQTKSMLVCPMIGRKGTVIGVLQLINAVKDTGELSSFVEAYEAVIQSLASQAGIAIENTMYIDEIRCLFESFVKVIATTIDERTPYNRRHSENLAKRVVGFGKYLNTVEEGPLADVNFTSEDLYQLRTAGWLHDIGKIVVPLDILDKPDRLHKRYDVLMKRYAKIEVELERNYYKMLVVNPEVDKDTLTAEFEEQMAMVEHCRQFVMETNNPSTFVDDERIEEINKIHNMKFEGIEEPLLTEEELMHLSIRKGTLTAGERKVIEKHMTAGIRILSELEFPDYLNNIYDWIINHHEYLNGTGYPRAISSEDISVESRMITMLDIFDSLVQNDRPYKKAFTGEKAIQILGFMCDEGKLDRDVVNAFVESELWRVNIEEC